MGSQILLSENGASAQRATYTQSALEGGLVFGDAPLPPREAPDVPRENMGSPWKTRGKQVKTGGFSGENGWRWGLKYEKRWFKMVESSKIDFFVVLNIQSAKYGEITMQDTGARAFGWI